MASLPNHSSLFTTERGGQLPTDYEPPDLFPDAGDYPSRIDLRHYVRGRLLEMVEDGSFSVMDIHNQHIACCEAAGMIILGQRFDEETREMKHDDPCPDELLRYKVKIRAIGDHPIKYKLGRANKGRSLGAAPREKSRVQRKPRLEDVWAVSDKKELDVPLPEAWKILHQHGKYCRPANREGLRKIYWLFEEVRPPKPKRKAKPKGNFATV